MLPYLCNLPSYGAVLQQVHLYLPCTECSMMRLTLSVNRYRYRVYFVGDVTNTHLHLQLHASRIVFCKPVENPLFPCNLFLNDPSFGHSLISLSLFEVTPIRIFIEHAEALSFLILSPENEAF